MKVHTTGKYAFELDKEEREILHKASVLLYDIANMMESKKYTTLTTGYEDNPYYYGITELREIADDVCEIKGAWEIEE